jgi:hypothetical protein
VEFVTLADKAQMPGLRSRVLDWPYVEGLRLDEAMHPLTLLAFGMYGEVLPNQNGAPLRLVVPWKYGFKSAKSIVKIRFTEKQPTAWNKAAPQEYGFYSNVNPKVDHPRWSQATERRIGEDGLFAKKRPTLMFNGYEAQVGQLYAGMDLRLGANPAQALIRSHGDWTLRMLCLVLAVTPLRVWTGWSALARLRRMLGLFVLLLRLLHLLALPGWTWALTAAILRDIAKRPFILVGSAGIAADAAAGRDLVRPGDPRAGWQTLARLHRAVYAVAICWRCCTSSGCARQERLWRGAGVWRPPRDAAGLARMAPVAAPPHRGRRNGTPSVAH